MQAEPSRLASRSQAGWLAGCWLLTAAQGAEVLASGGGQLQRPPETRAALKLHQQQSTFNTTSHLPNTLSLCHLRSCLHLALCRLSPDPTFVRTTGSSIIPSALPPGGYPRPLRTMANRHSDAGSDKSQPPPAMSTHEEFEHLADELLEKHGHSVVKLSELPDCECCTSGELCCGCRRVRPVHNSSCPASR